MKVFYTPHFKRSFKFLTAVIKKKFQKHIVFLLADIRHPSLRAKKYDEKRCIWQARIDENYRFYFLIEKDTYILIEIQSHSK